MPQLRPTITRAKDLSKVVNWYPGHMMAGLKAMIGKLNTVDCIIEVHDARIPFTGRNLEFRQHLGLIKPRLLLLNKSDLADMSRWEHVKKRLAEQGDPNVMATDFTGQMYAFGSDGYNVLLRKVVDLVHSSERYNRTNVEKLKIMVVGIPNVGKSTLINRLRQNFLGLGGTPAKVGSQAGVTKSVQQEIKICSRPPIYSLDTPGVLQPSSTKNHVKAMQLALCSTISDKVVNPILVAQYLLDHLNLIGNHTYTQQYDSDRPIKDLKGLMQARLEILSREYEETDHKPEKLKKIIRVDPVSECQRFIKLFRIGLFGLVMFD